MKERRNRRGKSAPVHARLETRKANLAKSQHEPPKKAGRKAPDLELLQALRAWSTARKGETAADEALSVAGRTGRFRLKGALDRIFRHYARLSWLIERQGLKPSPDMLWAAAAALLDGSDPAEISKAVAITSKDIRPLAGALGRMSGEGLTHPDMPAAVQLECPDQYFSILSDVFGQTLTQQLNALNLPANLDIRVNTLRVTAEALQDELQKADIAVKPASYAPLALQARGRPDLASTEAFAAGRFEIQDEGSQLVAMLVDAKPGQWVLDFCAGAGGKSLALAAAMGNKGHLVAADTSARRLTRAKLRFKRSGVENAERIQLTGTDSDPFLKKMAGRYDRVLVDAPCSGTGSWRRHPDAKWKNEADLPHLCALQSAILGRAARMVKRGGRMIYATCSLLPQENQDQVRAFLSAHPGFRLITAADIWRAALPGPWPCAEDDVLTLTPAQHGTDGFFAAVMERVA